MTVFWREGMLKLEKAPKSQIARQLVAVCAQQLLTDTNHEITS